MLRRLLVALLLTAALVTGCSDRRSVLTAGYESRFGHKRPPSPTATEAIAIAKRVEHEWRHELATRARQAPGQEFENPRPEELMSRLRAAARRYDFDIVSVTLLRPRQIAPKVIVRSTHYLDLARATHTILSRIDPRTPSGDDARGWRYEGFYFEAEDETGVPFLVTFNFWRGTSGGGGQWARSEPLYPFGHF